uniref:Ig-like domain-containing protein n=1 Tax=Otus sunia TaxID=257818 RepID=A0A8C8AD75_9STRI
VEKPGPVKVTAGDSCTLECTVDGTPELTARWFKDGNELSTDHKYKISFFNKVSGLKILNARLEDSGEYTFEVKNSVGKSSSSNVAGSDECSAFLGVRGQYQKEAGDRAHKFIFKRPSFFPLLHFSDYYALHEKFKCTSSLSVLFACLEPPSFVKKPEPLNVLSGANVTFTSIVKGSSPLEIKWFRGSVELVPGERCNITLQDSIAELELFDVHPLQSGDYTCQVSNEAGKISCTAHLFVKGLSGLLFLIDVHETVGLPVTFDCGIAGSEPIEEQPIDILELLKNVDPKEYEKYARMYGITDFRGLLQAFELLKQTQAEESHRLVRHSMTAALALLGVVQFL